MLADCGRSTVVEWNDLIHQCEITSFLEVGDEGENQPEGAIRVGLFIYRIPATEGEPA